MLYYQSIKKYFKNRNNVQICTTNNTSTFNIFISVIVKILFYLWKQDSASEVKDSSLVWNRNSQGLCSESSGFIDFCHFLESSGRGLYSHFEERPGQLVLHPGYSVMKKEKI